MSRDNSSHWKTFPSSLGQLIEYRSIKKKDLARIVGVKAATMSGWLGGTVRPSADMLFALADALRVSLDRLVGRMPPGAEALAPIRAAGLVVDDLIPPPARQDRPSSEAGGRAKRRRE